MTGINRHRQKYKTDRQCMYKETKREEDGEGRGEKETYG